MIDSKPSKIYFEMIFNDDSDFFEATTYHLKSTNLLGSTVNMKDVNTM